MPQSPNEHDKPTQVYFQGKGTPRQINPCQIPFRSRYKIPDLVEQMQVSSKSQQSQQLDHQLLPMSQ
jgi:hypothetical protein